MTRLTRTIKLLYCLCIVKYISSSKWLVESAKAGKFLSPDDYKIDNSDFDDNFKCDIYKSLESIQRNKLFSGKTFYLTPSVVPSVKVLVKLIELCGGEIEKVRRSSVRIQETSKTHPDAYIILSCINDLHLLADICRPNKTNRIICTTEYVMKSIMTQSIDIDQHVINYF